MSSEKTVERPRPELSAAKRALIEARLRGQVRSSGIVPRAHGDGAPLSFAQERLWFLDRLEPGSATYNIAWPLRLRGTPDAGALERALGEIVRRHESLRTVFREVDGSPVQVIAPFGGFTLPVERPVRAGRGGARGGDAAPRRRRRRRGRSTWPRDRSSARRCCGWARRARAAARDAPHRQRRVEHGGALPRVLGAVRGVPRGRGSRRCPSCRCSTPTTPCGSASSCGARRWSGSSRTGGSGWRARRSCWSCPPTIPARPCRRSGGRTRADRASRRAAGAAPGAGPERGSDAVHGGARRLPGAAVEVRRERGRRRGQPHRGAHAGRRWRS